MTIFLDDVAADVASFPETQFAGFKEPDLSQVPAQIPTHNQMLTRIDALVPRLRERAEETERLRRIPDSTMAELKEAGVFSILAPTSVGGYGMGVDTYVEVVRRLGTGCPSTAWN